MSCFCAFVHDSIFYFDKIADMHVGTKLGLAEWYDRKAAMWARNAARYNPPPGQRMRDSQRHRQEVALANVSRYRATAQALRMLTTEQEVSLLEWQVGGPDGIGIESYENPITVIRPEPDPDTRPLWQRMIDAI